MEPPCNWDHLVRGSFLQVEFFSGMTDSRTMVLGSLQSKSRELKLNVALSYPHLHPPPYHLWSSLPADTLPPPPAKSSVLVILSFQLLKHFASLQKGIVDPDLTYCILDKSYIALFVGIPVISIERYHWLLSFRKE